MTDQLKQHILQFANPSDGELNAFLDSTEFIAINNKEVILKQNQYCKYQYFVLNGCFRSYFINEKGVEKNVNFAIENWWITDYDSFVNNSLTHLNIQAIEDSQVLRISKTKLESVLDQSGQLNRYFRILLEKVRIADQKRIHYMFNLSGKELYDVFCDRNPDFVQRVPQYMLASYLGFTPEFLSKIRRLK